MESESPDFVNRLLKRIVWTKPVETILAKINRLPIPSE